ncbi:MAG: hypothetical protein PVF68_15960 [Acidobacteriota bacterium]|jgi:hypothetical protein
MRPAPAEHLIRCPHCLADHDALQAIWCSCDPQNPTKLCPFCLECFCNADPDFRDAFWRDAPPALLEERRALRESRLLLGDMLVRAGVITTDQLLQALVRQKQEGGRVGDALVALGYLTKERIDEFVRVQHSVVTFDINPAALDLTLVREVGVAFCRRNRILPLERETLQNRTLVTLAMADPADTETIQQVQGRCACQVVAGRAADDAIRAGLDACFPDPAESDPGDPPARTPEAGAPDPGPLLDRLLCTGLERGADDLHLRSEAGRLEARYRIRGRGFRAACPSDADANALLAELRRRAGGGDTLRFSFGGGEVDLRLDTAGGGGEITIRFGS